jgi:SH3 domain
MRNETDYNPAGQAGMVPLRAGQEVTIVEHDGADWWMAEIDGSKGWVPSAYVQML